MKSLIKRLLTPAKNLRKLPSRSTAELNKYLPKTECRDKKKKNVVRTEASENEKGIIINVRKSRKT